jgi:hypothetical protein
MRAAHPPLSAPRIRVTGARLRGAAAVTLRPSNADPDTGLHGSPGPSTPGNPPARDSGTTLRVCLPRATKISDAHRHPRAGSCRHTYPERCRLHCGGRRGRFPRAGPARRNLARAREGSPPTPLPQSLTHTEPERSLSLRRRFRKRDRSLTPGREHTCGRPMSLPMWTRTVGSSGSTRRSRR